MTFEVPGPLATQGSHRIGRGRAGRAVVVPVSSAKLAEYRRRVATAARAKVWRDRSFPFSGPVRLEIDFFRTPPKRGNLPRYPSTRPDIDKLARAVLDALSGVLYHDDGQVVELILTKRWGEPLTQVCFQTLDV